MQRLASKRRLLTMFESENGHFLVHLFGHPDCYRTIDPAIDCGDTITGYVSIGGKKVGPSVVICWMLLYSVFIMAAFLTASSITALRIEGRRYIALGLSVLAMLLLAVSAKRGGTVERRGAWLCISSGILLALLTELVR
jgi:hypothetical protein